MVSYKCAHCESTDRVAANPLEGSSKLHRRTSMHEREGKLASGTGAARGTGATIAKTMVESGARVVLGDILVEHGRETA